MGKVTGRLQFMEMQPEQLKAPPFPRTGSLQEKADWYRINARPEERLATAAHELGHYELAKRAGVEPEGITIGHHPVSRKSASDLFGGEIDTGLTHSIDQWQQKALSIGNAVEQQRFLTSYLESLYAGEANEDIITGKASNSGVADSALARSWMMRFNLSDDVMYRKEIELKRHVRQELSKPETKRKLAHAAQQLAEHHFDGHKTPSSTIDHYLSGGTRQSLPTGLENGA